MRKSPKPVIVKTDLGSTVAFLAETSFDTHGLLASFKKIAAIAANVTCGTSEMDFMINEAL